MSDPSGVSYCVTGQEGIIHDREAGRLLVLNATARTVWTLAGEGATVAAIALSLCETFAGVEPGRATQDVLSCLSELRKLGMALPPLEGEPDGLGQA